MAALPARPTVLLAEDDDDFRDVLVEVLELEGFEPLAAGDGASALALSGGRTLWAAVVDLHLPGLSGAVLADELRRRQPGLPVLLMSGADAGALISTVPAGVAVLSKPFAWGRLVGWLRDLG